MMQIITINPWTYRSKYRRKSIVPWLVLLSIIVIIKCAILVYCSSISGDDDLGHEFENGHNNYDIDKFFTVLQREPSVTSELRKEPQNSIEIMTSSHSPNSDSIKLVSDDLNNDGICNIAVRLRHSLLPNKISPGRNVDIVETALICSQVTRLNYKEEVTRIFKGEKLAMEQIHIVTSEPSVVMLTVDQICRGFDCSKITVFNVSGQEIVDPNKLADWLKSLHQLEVLDLSSASLKSIQSVLPVESITLKNLTHLHLDGNKLNELDFDFLLEYMPNLRYLSLVNNNIHSIRCNESMRSRLYSQLETISLAGNAINCDKGQLWFLKLLQDPSTSTKFPEHDHIKCSSPEHLIDMTWVQRISVHETKICDGCVCRSLKRTAISVDCHNKNLTALPDVLPLNTKILNLTSNRINSLSVPQNSRNWENVTYVHLENNLISSFQHLEVNSKFMRNLAALDIRRNRFQEFPSHILEQFINLDQVHLSNNPWLCDCESAFAFQEWLQRQFHKVGDKEEIRCGVPGNEENGLRSIDLKQRLSSRVIYKLSKSELCPQDNLEEPYDWLDIVNLALGITIILIITKVIMDYIYQRRTKRLPHFFKLNI